MSHIPKKGWYHNPNWAYFEKIDKASKKARCRVCNGIFSYASTSHNLFNHLRRRHRNVLSESSDTSKDKIWEFFSKNDDEVSCNNCDKTFTDDTEIIMLKTHLMHEHSEEFDKLVEFRPGEEEETFLIQADDDSDGPETVNCFERDEGRARCVLCDATMRDTPRAMRRHLKSRHQKLVGDQNSDTENADNDDIYTEVVYLDDEMPRPKKISKAPDVDRFSNVPIIKTPKKRNVSFERHRKDSSDDEPVHNYSKNQEEDEELNKFSKYIVCLLKTVPKDVSTKLQMDIVNLIMTAKLKSAQTVQNENKVVIDGVPVTLQAVGTVPGTGIFMMPNNTNVVKNDSTSVSNGSSVTVTETATPAATTVSNSLFTLTRLNDVQNDSNEDNASAE